ncbi:MAG: tRNA pseudouridine(13) synthase TruD [Planctomycetes bacterium]|nr:tRNA pseudouridine(13) synthase TruD [Planctomycetota bacterium]
MSDSQTSAEDPAEDPAEVEPTKRPQAPIPPELQRGYLTADLAPIEGGVREQPEDFVVEEIPLYEPCGEGEHLYLWIEKRGIPTHEAVRLIAKRLNASQRGIGTAGLKDAKAITRQWISVHKKSVADAERAGGDQITVLEAKLHTNKLRTGHLRGNRFRLLLRGAAEHEASALATLKRLAERGVPNGFGLQRFGWERSTHLCGEAVLRGDHERLVELVLLGPPGSVLDHRRVLRAREAVKAADYVEAGQAYPPSCAAERALCRHLAKGKTQAEAARAIPRRQRDLYVNAFQSQLFNAYLAARLETTGVLEVGEIATIHRNGASFVVVDAAAEAPRCASFEISPSGPLFGKKLLRPSEGSVALALEESILAEHDFGPTLWGEAGLGRPPLGSRRPLRIPLGGVLVEREGEHLRIGFELPKGCYATSVLEELFKRQID